MKLIPFIRGNRLPLLVAPTFIISYVFSDSYAFGVNFVERNVILREKFPSLPLEGKVAQRSYDG